LASPETIAAEFLSTHTREELVGLESQLVAEGAALDRQIAVKLARSKSLLGALDHPVHVSVVFAMYKETERMLPASEHPHGEDFINLKVSQLRWLFDGDRGWDLVIVDDGCPDGSGELAERIIRDSGLGRLVRVLYLRDAIDAGHPVVVDLESTEDSRKGGSIELGMYEAARSLQPGHIVAYTDADSSTNLAQAGLLVDALSRGHACAAGSRREATSVLVKSGARNDRGKLFIYIWKQMLPQLGEIIDTQCGFKAFRGEDVADLVTDTIEKKFAFDIEILLRCAIKWPDAIARVPIAWVDSEAASTTTDLEPYLPMLQSVARMYRRYGDPNERAGQFADLIESMDDDAWTTMVGSIPAAIVGREPRDFASWAGVSAKDLARSLVS